MGSFQETEMDILATVQNLLRRCVQPAAFLRPLSKLFSVVHNKLPRKALVAVFQVGTAVLSGSCWSGQLVTGC